MPAHSEKQRKFFGLVRAIQKGEKPSSDVGPEVRKVAKSITAKDAGDFASSVAEVKLKKAVLQMLKDCREPMYLEEEEQEINPVGKTFTVKDDFERYVSRYGGQKFSPKEIAALDNFKDAKATKIDNQNKPEIRFETTDEFQNTTTTVIKKMKDSGQFSFNAFSKHTKVEPDEPEEPGAGNTGTEMPGAAPAEPPMPSLEEWLDEQDAVPMEEPKEDIIVTKSILFKDDIKGAALLVEFLKKLDL